MPSIHLPPGWGRALGVLLLCLTLTAVAYPAVSAAQPAPQRGGPYDEWLRKHRVTAEVRLVLTYDGRLLRYRKVLEGPELKEKLGVERLVGEEAAVEVTEEGLSELVTSLGLSEEEASRLKSGGTVEVLSVPYAGTCTPDDIPPTWWDQYPYPKYSWERFETGSGWVYYCTADPMNLVWYRGDGQDFTWLSPIIWELSHDGWTPTWLEATNYVYDPIYGWEAQQDSRDKDYPTSDYDRYHVRLWKVHKWGYGRVDVVGQAHVDTPWWQGGHEAVLFEEAEAEVRKAFETPYYYDWVVEGEVVWLGNYDEGGDGWATRIRYEG